MKSVWLSNKKNTLHLNIATNLVLSVLVLSIGTLCLAPLDSTVSSKNEEEIYRCAGENAKGVSLMFNVYSGTDEVYRILEILDNYNAKATFFIGGCWADDNVECLKTIANNGHEIGNHGYFHKDHDKLSLTQNQKEISTCNKFIEASLGKAPILFAPPSGAYNNDTLTACKTLNMKTILWSKDTIDWRDHNPALIYTRATKDVKNGDFVLMHPTQATANALGDILKYYTDINIKTVTVLENIQMEG